MVWNALHGTYGEDGAVQGLLQCMHIACTIEVRPAKGFYDYEAKYERNDTEYLIPAPISESLSTSLQTLALEAHRALGCSSYSRVDIRVRENGEAFVLEVNTLPGMTGASLMPKLAKHAGIRYPELCEQSLLLAQ